MYWPQPLDVVTLEKGLALYCGCNPKILGSVSNIVYEVTYIKDPSKKFILRFGERKRRSIEEVQSELHWISYLRENGIPVVSVIPSKNGNTVELLSRDSDKDFYNVVAFEFCPGAPFSPTTFQPNLIRKYGSIMGKIHFLSKSYQPHPSVIPRKTFLEDWISKFDHIIDWSKVHPPQLQTKFQNLVTWLRSLPTDEHHFGLVHGDFHLSNFHISESEEFFIFDWDDSSYQWFINELVVAFYSVMWQSDFFKEERVDTFKDEFLRLFLDGYKEYNDVDEHKLLDWFHNFYILRHFVMFFILFLKGDTDQDFLNQVAEEILSDTPLLHSLVLKEQRTKNNKQSSP